MKRSIIALAAFLALGLSGTPQAQAQIAVYGQPNYGVPVYGQTHYETFPAYGRAPVASRSFGSQGRRVSRQTGIQGRNVGRQMGAQGRSVGRPINPLSPSVGRTIRNQFPALAAPPVYSAEPLTPQQPWSGNNALPQPFNDGTPWNNGQPADNWNQLNGSGNWGQSAVDAGQVGGNLPAVSGGAAVQ